MALQFITEGAIGPKERKLIRSHVMKGKNAGRPRPPRRTLRDVCTSSQDARHTTPPGYDHSKANELEALYSKQTLRLNRILWNDLTLASFPLYASPESGRFVYQWVWYTSKVVYSQIFCSELNLSQYAWFQDFLEDKAFFHCLLAISASFTDHFGGTLKEDSFEAVQHISQAYKLITERLSTSEACSDKAIGVVTVLAIYQRLHGQQSLGLVHFKGLHRMIQLRGGLAKLAKENRTLAQKPWRLDVEFALQDGSSTNFSPDDMPSGFMSLNPRNNLPVVQVVPSNVNLYYGISPEVINLLLDITDFTQLLNTTQQGAKLDPMDYAECVIGRLHRLLHFAPVAHQRLMDPLDNLVHVALVATMTTLMPEYGRNMARYDLLANHFRGALWTYAATPERNASILLWALFVGFVTVLGDDDHTWLASLVGKVCVYLDLHSWLDVSSILCRYAWVGVLYDTPGLRLWNMAEGRRYLGGIH